MSCFSKYCPRLLALAPGCCDQDCWVLGAGGVSWERQEQLKRTHWSRRCCWPRSSSACQLLARRTSVSKGQVPHKQDLAPSLHLSLLPGRTTSKPQLTHLYRLWCQAFPLLGRLLHGFTQRLCIFHHCFQLRVCQHPQQVIKEKHQLRCHHIAVFGLKQQGVRGFKNCNQIHAFFKTQRSCHRSRRCCSATHLRS